MNLINFGILTLLFAMEARSYSSSLADCKVVAKLFKNTCTTAPDYPATWTNLTSTQVTCTNQVTCTATSAGVAYGTAPSCSWPRKLCVSCGQATNGTVYMRIQSNGLPDHCFQSPGVVKEKRIDLKIKWNPTGGTNKTFSSQSSFDAQACDIMKTQSVPSTSEIYYYDSTYTAGSYITVSAFAINGIQVLSSLSAEYVDPFFPKEWSGSKKVQVEGVDSCLGHPEPDGNYHYHFMPPCLVDAANIDTSKPCSEISACATDVRAYSLSHFANSKTLTVLGLAKDGHVIVGPYQSDGTLFDCSTFDQCGGTYLSDGSYVYVFSQEFPYQMNCFGPAGPIVYEASCSTNTCSASHASSGEHLMIHKLLLALTLLITFVMFN